MKTTISHTICAATLAAVSVLAQDTVVIEPAKPAGRVTVHVESADAALPEREPVVALLVVQNHASAGARVPILALTDALTAKLSSQGFCIINPYNSVGVDQNRTVAGEKTPQASVLELARKLGAGAIVTASVTEFLDSTIGNPPILHRFSVRMAFSLSDAETGAAVCGYTIEKESPKYTVKEAEANRQRCLGDLLHAAAGECAAQLAADPAMRVWRPTPPPPAPPAPPPPPPPGSPALAISDIDSAVASLFGKMRANPVFRSNYDKAQGELGRAPLAIVSGIVDLTKGKSPSAGLADLLAAASQGVRMAFVNSGLFEAKDDVLVTAITKRIIESGNSPLEDGELMAALKQHGSPDFYVVGDMMYFVEGDGAKYRLRMALHDLHTGKIVWEGAEMIAKPASK